MDPPLLPRPTRNEPFASSEMSDVEWRRMEIGRGRQGGKTLEGGRRGWSGRTRIGANCKSSIHGSKEISIGRVEMKGVGGAY